MKNKLSEICFGITDGSHNPPKSGEKSDYLMLSSKNVYDDQITFEDPRYLSEEQFVSENRRTNIKPGDVLMTIVGTVGRTAVVKEGTLPITLQRSVAVLHPNTDICSSRYLMYLLRSKRSFFEAEAHGVAQKGIYLKQLSDVKVAIPEIAKQHEVVTILDKICEVIHAREAEMVALDDLIKARFVELFGNPMINDKGYPLKRYGDLFELNAGGTPSKSHPEYWENGTISWIGSNMCQNTYIYENDGNYITEEGYRHSSARMFPIDTVLVALVGATIGKTALLKFKTTTNQNVLGIRGIRESGYTPEFVYYYTQGLYDKFLAIGDGGFAMASKGFISNLQIPIVDLSNQMEFTSFANQVDKSKVAVQKALDEAQLLFDSLMQKYFG